MQSLFSTSAQIHQAWQLRESVRPVSYAAPLSLAPKTVSTWGSL